MACEYVHFAVERPKISAFLGFVKRIVLVIASKEPRLDEAVAVLGADEVTLASC